MKDKEIYVTFFAEGREAAELDDYYFLKPQAMERELEYLHSLEENQNLDFDELIEKCWLDIEIEELKRDFKDLEVKFRKKFKKKFSK